jgi:hypothetical protein
MLSPGIAGPQPMGTVLCGAPSRPGTGVVSSRRLADLERSERLLMIARTVVRSTLVVVLIFACSFVIPVVNVGETWALVRLVTGGVVFAGLLFWQMRRVFRADLPELRAIQGLAVAVPVFLCLFAAVYLALAAASPHAFSEPLDLSGALYLVVTIFSTVGFGDITPESGTARIIVGLQMLIDLVLLGGLVRLLLGAARAGLSRPAAPSGNASGDQGGT